MKKLLLALAALWALAPSAFADSPNSALVVDACGTPPQPFLSGRPAPLTVDSTGTLCSQTGGISIATVSIDQTTPGVSNAVNINGWNTGTNVDTGNGASTVTGTLRNIVSTDSPDVVSLGDPTNAAWTTGSGALIPIAKAIDRELKTGTVTLSQATMANSVPVTMASDQQFASIKFFQPTASDNHTNIKNAAGVVHWVLAENNSSTVNYLRFYDAGSSFNGCGSATGLVNQIMIPAQTTVGGINIVLGTGLPFATGISYCVTSGYATTDTNNATASAMAITIGYN